MRIDNFLTQLHLRYQLIKKKVPAKHIGKNILIKSGLRVYIGKKCKEFVISDEVKINRNVDIEVGGSLTIGPRSTIGVGSFLQAGGKIHIGSGVLLGPYVKIFSTSHHYGRNGEIHQSLISGAVTISNNAWIGSGAVIALNVRIGNNSVIGANSFVNQDIPDNCVAAGVPAKIIKKF